MAYIVQAVVLLVSGVYYPVQVLPNWMQLLSTISPATYVIEGMRLALLEGADLVALWPKVWPALVVGVLSVPLGLRLFVAVERYAKRTGRRSWPHGCARPTGDIRTRNPRVEAHPAYRGHGQRLPACNA